MQQPLKSIAEMSKILILILFCILFLIAGYSVAQGKVENKEMRKGSIRGKVIDLETKSPLIGATVQIKDTKSGAYTESDGTFVINNVPVGSYTVTFSSIGYIPISKTDIIVRSARITNLSAELRQTTLKVSDIKVTAGYFHEIKDQPTSATSFSGEEIRRAPGSAGDVSRIVAVLPSIAKVNDMLNSLVVRGGSPSENAFFVDNMEIPNINHYPIQGTSGGPISLLNVDFIENVNFSAGGFSASYGDRLSSVMDIKFREGNRDEYDFQLEMSFGGFGITGEGPINKGKGSFMFSARRSFLDLLVDAIGTGVAPRYSDYQGKIVYDLSPSNRLSILGIYGHDNIDFTYEQSTEDKMPFYGLFKGYEFALGANWQYLWSDKGYSNTAFSFLGTKYDGNFYETFSDSTDKWMFTNNSLEDIFQIRNNNYYRFNDAVNLEFGVNLKYYHNDYKMKSAPFSNSLGFAINAMNIDSTYGAPKYGGFVQLSVNPFSKMTTSLGLRYDYSPFNERQHLSPRFSLIYNLSDRLTLKGATGIYCQGIPLSLLAQDKKFEKLDDPVAYHYIAGFDYLLTKETRFTLEAYYKDYRHFPMDPAQPQLFIADEISFQRIVGIFEDLDDNGRARSFGVEFTLQKKLAKDFYGLISGSVFKAEYEGLDGQWRNRIFDNHYLFSVEGGYKPNNSIEFSLRWILAGGPPYSPIDTTFSSLIGRTVYDVNRINDARYPAYHSLNLRFDKRYHFKNSNLVTFLSIWNVYNRKNVSMYYWNDIDGKVDQMDQWSFLPVGGFEFEF